MPDYSAYQVDLDTPQPGGGRGESPRSAFSKLNELMVTLGTDINAAATQIADAGDLNARVSLGDFYVTVAQTNQPAGLAGSYFFSVRGQANAIVQEIVMRQSTARRWWRMLYLSDGSWTEWREVADVTPLAASVVAAGTDANTLVVPGPYYVDSDAQATAALNWPVTLAGTLEVIAAAAGNLQVTQVYTTRNGTGGVIRQFVRVRFGAGGGSWGTWQEIARQVDITALDGRATALEGRATTLEGQMFGRSQSWQNVTASRAANGTTYTNSTTRPILVAVSHVAAGTNISYLVNIDGLMVARPTWPETYNGGVIAVSFIVPPGSTYSVSGTGLSALAWQEYR